jgi:hypothetical protein
MCRLLEPWMSAALAPARGITCDCLTEARAPGAGRAEPAMNRTV